MIARLLSHDFAGLLVGVCVLIVSVVGLRWLRTLRLALAVPMLVLSGVTVFAAALICIGGAVHMVTVLRDAHRYPAPGKLIDVGGYNIHLWCEGPLDGGPPVVWISGDRGEGIELYHLQKVLRTDHRSCLVDRSGVGWSDIGPFPKTIESDVNEISLALERSGEKGPFVLVGWSLGGLLAENIAARHPSLLVGLVLLDATSPDLVAFGGEAMCTPLIAQTTEAAMATQIGLEGLLWRRLVEPGRSPGEVEAQRDVESIRRSHEDRGRNWATLADTVRTECANPLSLIRFPEALGDLPTAVIIPEEDFEGMAARHQSEYPFLDDIQFKNLFNIYRQGQRARANLSRRSVLFTAPMGTHHDFVYSAPAFVIDHVRALLRSIAQPGVSMTVHEDPAH